MSVLISDMYKMYDILRLDLSHVPREGGEIGGGGGGIHVL